MWIVNFQCFDLSIIYSIVVLTTCSQLLQFSMIVFTEKHIQITFVPSHYLITVRTYKFQGSTEPVQHTGEQECNLKSINQVYHHTCKPFNKPSNEWNLLVHECISVLCCICICAFFHICVPILCHVCKVVCYQYISVLCHLYTSVLCHVCIPVLQVLYCM